MKHKGPMFLGIGPGPRNVSRNQRILVHGQAVFEILCRSRANDQPTSFESWQHHLFWLDNGHGSYLRPWLKPIQGSGLRESADVDLGTVDDIEAIVAAVEHQREIRAAQYNR